MSFSIAQNYSDKSLKKTEAFPLNISKKALDLQKNFTIFMSQNKQKSKILRIMTKIVFKGDFQHQNLILPPSLEELIPEVHPVRVVSQIVDNLNISDLLEEYKGGGTSSFHPRMLLKVLI